jgi:hypothetical protein
VLLDLDPLTLTFGNGTGQPQTEICGRPAIALQNLPLNSLELTIAARANTVIRALNGNIRALDADGVTH